MSRAVPKAVLVATVDYWAMAWYEMNDDGNALRLLDRARGRLVHVREWGWLAYDEQRWSAEDGKRRASLMSLEVSRGIRDEIAALKERDDKDFPIGGLTKTMRDDRVLNLSQWRVQSGNATKSRSMLETASTLTEFNRDMDEFDADLLAVNCLNKTIRFVEVPEAERISEDADTPEWRVAAADHDPSDHITRVTACDWNQKADMAPWQAHIEAVLPSPEVRWYFQKIMGYAALGSREEQIFVMLQGKGGDGKSTTMDVIRTILGRYAVVGNVKLFLAEGMKDADAATPALIRLVGDTRLISVGEPKRNKALAEEMVKSFTGGSALPARANYGDEFEFDPRGLVVMEVNSRPRISGDDDGIWGRIVIILFPRQFRRKVGWQKKQKAMLLANRDGVFRWLVEGALGYLHEGLTPPAEVAAAIEEYRRSANPFSQWMAERADLADKTAVTLASELYGDYKKWCEDEQIGERDVISSTAFGRSLGDHQLLLGPRHRTGKKTRRGIRLRAVGEVLSFEDADVEDDTNAPGPEEDGDDRPY